MSEYPGEIDVFRDSNNIPGITYEPTDYTTIYAEDVRSWGSAIVAIESVLGVNPQDTFETVSDRIAAAGGGGGSQSYNLDGGRASANFGGTEGINGGIASTDFDEDSSVDNLDGGNAISNYQITGGINGGVA